MMFKKTTLKNGLRIITVPQKGAGAVTVLVLVGTGSKYEAKETAGISHFLEHMFFKGTKKRPDKLEIAETLDKIGGMYNAFTGEDCTGYFAKVAAGQFDLALDWVSDIYLKSILPGKEINREKGVIIEEMNMIYDNPMFHVMLLWSKLLYGDQPAGWDILGTKESIIAMDRQKLLNYMKSQYTASNTVVCVAGNIKSNQAINKVKKSFSSIDSAEPSKKPKVIERQTGPECLIFEKQTDQTHLCLGVRTYNIFHPQRYAQDILGVILGGMMSSRLFMEVREKLGLAYYISTSVDINEDTGFLLTRAGVDNKKAEKAVSVILKEYKKISSEKVPEAELKKAKEYVKGKMALGLESSDALASFYGLQELLEKEALTPKEIYDKIDQVSSQDVLKVARDIFQPKKMNLALIGPFDNKKTFEKILKL
ncbi:MAG: pitrilysin family protein [Candidatus Nealsonbacteria bacterium]|nr:pitrilysin family protein [Candidatus Nealsonbacteria bacterium]